MPLRISYWTGWLDPQMVAVSKEVFQLLRRFPGSRAFGISPHYWLKWSRSESAFGIHPAFYPFFRQVMPFLERRFDVSHVYTSLGDWHFLNGLGERPILLTLTQNSPPAAAELLSKVRCVAAESEPLAVAAIAAGIPAERVEVIYPGVDLDLFREFPPPSLPWKCLFASSPENADEIHTKGVDLLLDLASQEPALEITLVWRPFGRRSHTALDFVHRAGLANVRILEGRVADMHRLYGQHHFTVAPFRRVGKPCPNSILESLACGRPALVSRFVDIGSLLESEGAGITFPQTKEGLREAFAALRDCYDALQKAARPCAEKYFDLRQTVARYSGIYGRLAGGADPFTGLRKGIRPTCESGFTSKPSNTSNCVASAITCSTSSTL
jgi:glycosyltransferase involved in cell wall biosynthesis